MSPPPTEHAGLHVRRWRDQRRRSQLDVAVSADISTRHLSYIETGRSTPSRRMIERICDELDVPLRDRNQMYLAAGFAPVHPERPLDDLADAHLAVEALLHGHEPNPSAAVNTQWDLVAANDAMRRFLTDLSPKLVGPPLNMMRATLHPEGLAPRIRNQTQWREVALRRVRRQLDRLADPVLAALLDELESYPALPATAEDHATGAHDVITPLVLATPFGDLSFLYAVTVLGAPRDITLDEIAIETFFPADSATRAAVAAMAGQRDDIP